MKITEKIVSLLNNGMNKKLVSSLTEGQVNALYKRLVESKKENKEAVTKTSTTTTYDLGNPSDVTAANKSLQGMATIDPTNKKMIVTKEEQDMDEEGLDIYSDPDASADGMGMFEGDLDEKFESKAQQKYFWARCGDKKISPAKRKKWCDMAKEFSKETKNFDKLPEKKKETKEGYLDMMGKAYNKTMKNKLPEVGMTGKFTESELEKKIMSLVEKHLTPKMTKGEFISLFTEQKPVIAPPKPKTPKIKPDTPYSPKPGIKPAPKAGNNPVIAPPKPKTPKIKPDTPYSPKPGIKPAPKAGEIPSWLSFESIGINLK